MRTGFVQLVRTYNRTQLRLGPQNATNAADWPFYRFDIERLPRKELPRKSAGNEGRNIGTSLFLEDQIIKSLSGR